MRRKAEIDALRDRLRALLNRHDLSDGHRHILAHMKEALDWVRECHSRTIDKLLSGEIPREEKTNDA